MSHWARRLEQVDRRYIFLVMAAAMILPLLRPIGLIPETAPAVRAFHQAIESLPPGSVVLVADDWDPGSIAELKTASVVVHEHLFARGIRFVDLTLWEGGTGIVQRTLDEVAERAGKKYGEDYVYLGFKAGREQAMLPIAEDIRKIFPKDYYGTPVDQIPVMQGIHKLEDFAMILSVSAGYPGTKEWVQQVGSRFPVPMVSACGGVSAPEYFAYYESGQLKGLVGGLQAMASYEQLIGRPAFATRAMDAQSIGHFTLLALILIGNVLYFAGRRSGEA